MYIDNLPFEHYESIHPILTPTRTVKNKLINRHVVKIDALVQMTASCTSVIYHTMQSLHNYGSIKIDSVKQSTSSRS